MVEEGWDRGSPGEVPPRCPPPRGVALLHAISLEPAAVLAGGLLACFGGVCWGGLCLGAICLACFSGLPSQPALQLGSDNVGWCGLLQFAHPETLGLGSFVRFCK